MEIVKDVHYIQSHKKAAKYAKLMYAQKLKCFLKMELVHSAPSIKGHSLKGTEELFVHLICVLKDREYKKMEHVPIVMTMKEHRMNIENAAQIIVHPEKF